MNKEKLNKSLKIFRWIGSRVIVFYFILFLGASLLVDFQNVNNKAKIATLNRLRPTYDHLAQFIIGREELNKEKFAEYIYYYKKVVDYVPRVGDQPFHIADAYATMGYCHYHLGKNKEAIKAYQKAIELKPEFFWFHYNLGLLYFNQGEYRKAEQALKKAVTVKPELSLKSIMFSKIHRPIINKIKATDKSIDIRIAVNLKGGYVKATKILVLTYYHLEDYRSAVQVASKAIDVGIGDSDFFFYHAGLSAYKKGQYRLAISFLQRYIERNLRNPDAFYYLGLSWKALGSSASIKALRQAEVLRKMKGATSTEDEKFKPFIF